MYITTPGLWLFRVGNDIDSANMNRPLTFPCGGCVCKENLGSVSSPITMRTVLLVQLSTGNAGYESSNRASQCCVIHATVAADYVDRSTSLNL